MGNKQQKQQQQSSIDNTNQQQVNINQQIQQENCVEDVVDFQQQQNNVDFNQLEQVQNVQQQNLQQYVQINYQQQNISQQQAYIKPKAGQKRKEIQYNFSNSLAQQKIFKSDKLQTQQVRSSSNEQEQCDDQSTRVVNEEILKNFVNDEQCDNEQNMKNLDQYNNYKDVYLGKEGQFKDYKIIIGSFCWDSGTFQSLFMNTGGKELQRLGFSFTAVYNEDEFVKQLDNFDMAWIVSGDHFIKGSQDNFVKKVKEFIGKKKSLFFWTDNDPLYCQANIICKELFDGMYAADNYYGYQIIYGDDKASQGKFDYNHAIAYGLNNFFEGDTISHPEKIHKDFQIFAYNAKNEPLVLYAEENENHGRILFDFGFTKLYPQFWDRAGTRQYISNCAVWLTGIVQ